MAPVFMWLTVSSKSGMSTHKTDVIPASPSCGYKGGQSYMNTPNLKF